MISRTALFALVLVITVPALGKPSDKASYRITELPALNPGNGNTFVSDINDKGTVVGGSSRSDSGSNDDVRVRPVVWTSEGVVTELPVISTNGVQGGARGINGAGRIVGLGHVAGLDAIGAHALRFEGNPPEDLGTLPGDGFSTANRINNGGTIVGFSGPELFFLGGSTAVAWDKKTGIRNLGRLPGAFDSEAYGINEKGTIVGVSGDLYLSSDGLATAVYWDKTGIHALPGRPGDVWSSASAVNNADVIVGSTANLEQTNAIFFPFLFPTTPVRWVKGKIEVLPLLPGDNSGQAFAINASGVIVGESASYDAFGFPVESHPVAWIDGEVIDLNSVDLGVAGWVITRATAVNDRGQIAGNGTHDGVQAGFVLTPGKKSK